MAASLSGYDFTVVGDKRGTLVTITGDTSYPSGGYSVSAQQLGMGTVLFVDSSFAVSSVPAVRAITYNTSTNKLVFYGETFAEISNGTDLSAYAGKVMAYGW